MNEPLQAEPKLIKGHASFTCLPEQYEKMMSDILASGITIYKQVDSCGIGEIEVPAGIGNNIHVQKRDVMLHNVVIYFTAPEEAQTNLNRLKLSH